jgi:16S rRNA (cytosine967-C5)-methyltransferase
MRIRLEWDLAQLLRNPDKLPGEMRLILGLAAYELAYLRIPAHATVNLAVTRVRNRFGQGLAGVANGTPRAFAKIAKKYEDESRYAVVTDSIARLAVIHAVPEWIAELWVSAYGFDTALKYLRASSGRAVPAVRVNTARDDAASVRQTLLTEGKGTAVAAFGVAFPKGAPNVAKTFERKGRVSFQSAAVQEILEELGFASWIVPVWDACAGRGGKKRPHCLNAVSAFPQLLIFHSAALRDFLKKWKGFPYLRPLFWRRMPHLLLKRLPSAINSQQSLLMCHTPGSVRSLADRKFASAVQRPILRN